MGVFSTFRGPAYQKGHGLGGLFSSLFRSAIPVFRNTVAPVLKKGAKALAKEALNVGVGVGGDLLSGEAFQDSVKRRVNTSARKMAKQGVRKLGKLVGSTNVPRPGQGVE